MSGKVLYSTPRGYDIERVCGDKSFKTQWPTGDLQGGDHGIDDDDDDGSNKHEEAGDDGRDDAGQGEDEIYCWWSISHSTRWGLRLVRADLCLLLLTVELENRVWWWWEGRYADWCEQEQLERTAEREHCGETVQFTILRVDTFQSIVSLQSPTSHINPTNTDLIHLTLRIIKTPLSSSTQTNRAVKTSNMPPPASPDIHIPGFIWLPWLPPPPSWHILHIVWYLCSSDLTARSIFSERVRWQNDKPATGSLYTTHKEPWHNSQCRRL